MQQTFNFTGRQRLYRQDINLTLSSDKHLIAEIDINQYKLDDEDIIILLIIGSSLTKEYNDGTIQEKVTADYNNRHSIFEDFNENEPLKCDIIIKDNNGKIKARTAKEIPLNNTDLNKSTTSLLEIEYCSLDGIPYQIIETGDRIRLQIEKELGINENWEKPDDQQLNILYYMLSDILNIILFSPDIISNENFKEWKEYFENLMGGDKIPEQNDPYIEKYKYIENVKRSFCKTHKIVNRLKG